jgi:hypothetical protein
MPLIIADLDDDLENVGLDALATFTLQKLREDADPQLLYRPEVLRGGALF